MFKVCHQLCYGFENLMSSWRVWISFSKLLWGNVFLKNHAKSKVFQNNRRQQAFFVKFWCQVGKFGYNSHGRNQSFRSFDQAGTLSLRGPAQFTDEARSAEFANGLLKYYAVNVQEIFKISFTSHLLEFDQNSLAIHFLEIYQKKLGLTPFVIVKLANAQCSCVSKNEKEKKFREILPP